MLSWDESDLPRANIGLDHEVEPVLTFQEDLQHVVTGELSLSWLQLYLSIYVLFPLPDGADELFVFDERFPSNSWLPIVIFIATSLIGLHLNLAFDKNKKRLVQLVQ